VHVLLDISFVYLSKFITIYLMQNFMAEAANAANAAAAAAQDHMGGSVNQGYNSYPNNAPVYASPQSNAAGHAPSADYGPVYGTNYGY
jgi:poly(rC)-binding protein 2/3/4